MLRNTATEKRVPPRRFPTALRLSAAVLLLLLRLAFLPPALLASSDAPLSLASGKWARVSVTQAGMHFISDNTLRAMGFADPSHVTAVGAGGPMLSEDLPDPAQCRPLVPSPTLRTEEGICFFARPLVSWLPDGDDWLMTRRHTINPYSEKAFCLLTDSSPSEPEIPAADLTDTSGLPEITTFTQTLLHEQDITRPSQTGRTLLGEDFRGHPVRTFSFRLAGNTGDARVRVAFGSKVTNGSASLMVKANGTQLPSTTDDRIPAVATAETFLVHTLTSKRVHAPGDKLDLEIAFTYSGALATAALDFIEVEYERKLEMSGGQIVFTTDAREPSQAVVEGASPNTVVWETTSPACIRPVATELQGTSLRFAVAPGFREFVAFDPSAVTLQPEHEGRVDNSTLLQGGVADLLIVSPEKFLPAALQLAQLHTETDRLEVRVATPGEIYCHFSSGTPDVSALRHLLAYWRHTAGKVPAVLILGRASNDPKGTARPSADIGAEVPVWQSADGLSASTSFSTDDFTAMLDPGPFNPSSARIHTPVGRWPVTSLAEAEAAVTKLRGQLANAHPGPWRNHVLLVADDGDNAAHLMQAEALAEALAESEHGRHLDVSRLYLDTFPLTMTPTGPAYPQATARLKEEWRQGKALVTYIGHANAREWGHEKLLRQTDLDDLATPRMPFLYAATCDFLAWDLDERSGAEKLWLNPKGGITGALCPSRKVFISLNGPLNNAFAPSLFAAVDSGQRLTVGEAAVNAKNADRGTNRLRYALLADPVTRLPWPRFNVALDSLGNSCPSDDDPPVIPALAAVEAAGRITDTRGETASGFNGTATLTFYDAETPVQSLGNGSDGKAVSFNDRGKPLFHATARVANGVWRTLLKIPADLSQNYGNARMVAYAADSLGNEAHGSSCGFILHGTGPTASGDTEGPEIKDFWLNSPLFSDGAVTGPSVLVNARIEDPSGIDMSAATTGKGLTLTLDGSLTVDAGNFLTPEPGGFTAAHLSHRLDNVAAGRHTLTLRTHDNAGNASETTLAFNVDAAWQPGIAHVAALTAPGDSQAVFLVETDGIDGGATCRIELFSLPGLHVATLTGNGQQRIPGTFSIEWNLRDRASRRVPPGIYPFRAVVTDSEGRQFSKSSKAFIPGL